VFTYLMLRTRDAVQAWILVFCAGLAMAPVFPTTLAIVGNTFTHLTTTAMGIVITCGWIGLAVSSRIIGSIAGDDPKRLKKALLLLPGMAAAGRPASIALQRWLRADCASPSSSESLSAASAPTGRAFRRSHYFVPARPYRVRATPGRGRRSTFRQRWRGGTSWSPTIPTPELSGGWRTGASLYCAVAAV